MYSHLYPTGAVAAGGTIAITSGWMVLGWALLGASALMAAGLTVSRLRRGRR
jgi:hypothetical protein